jgi:protein involved in polysaccharide export with SLBB domain
MTGQESITHPSATAESVSLVQNGWHAIAQDGEDLGEVVRSDTTHLVIKRDGLLTPSQLIIPRDVIDTEDEAAMEVFLTIDSAAADQFAGDSK